MTAASTLVHTLENLPTPPEGRATILQTRVVTDTGGGPDKTILLSARYMEDTPYWMAAAYMHPPDDPGFGAVAQRAVRANCPLVAIPDRGPLDRSVVRQLLDVCRRLNVKIWHGHDYKSNLFGLTLRPFHSMKLVSTVHGWVKQTTRTPLYYAIDRWCLPYYHHVICVSDDLMERALQVGVPRERCTLLPNAIDERTFVRKYPSHEAPLRQKFGTPKERLVIGAVGRLSAEKAFNNLIRATHTLLGEGLDIELWIAGDGDARPELEMLIDRLRLHERVRLLGFCDDIVNLYHAFDLFVLSSLREGLPNVVLEAMAVNVPVVSTRVAGVPKLIEDRVNGVLCPCGDVPALTDAMRHVLRDEMLRANITAAGRRTIEEQCSFAQRMRRERAIYDRVLGLPPDSSTTVPDFGA